MKLRIKGNSIRLRLLRSELDRFALDGRISEETSFGSATLRYSVAMSSHHQSVLATLDDNEIVVFIPELAARNWTTNDRVGFETEQYVGPNESLLITVEKDFVCIDRPND